MPDIHAATIHLPFGEKKKASCARAGRTGFPTPDSGHSGFPVPAKPDADQHRGGAGATRACAWFAEKESLKVKSLSVYDPEKVAKLLYLYSTTSQTRLVRKYGHEQTVISVLADYADHMGKFKELSGHWQGKPI